jgi:cyclic pyranopterin phosphate synthase
LSDVLNSIDICLAAGLHTKLNCVLLDDCAQRLIPLARFAEARPLDVRFIERMPIGAGAAAQGISRDEALRILRTKWHDLHPVASDGRGNGPAHYYASAALQGEIGMIDAVSHKFCESCNRVRVTATGRLKPCLCYGESVDLRHVLRTQPEHLENTLRDAIYAKPRAHCFGEQAAITERNSMSQIGG